MLIPWIQFLRVTAAFFIVLLHVSATLVMEAEINSTAWQVGNFFDSFSRWSLPVFVMLSGYLVLQKDCQTGEFYRKKFSRIIIPLLFWSVVYSVFQYIKGEFRHEPLELAELWQAVLNGAPYYHLWYMYMLIGLFLFAPFIRKAIDGLTNRELGWLCALLFFYGIVNDACSHFMRGGDKGMFINWFVLYLGYFVAGHYLCRLSFMPNKNWLLAAFIISGLAVFFLTGQFISFLSQGSMEQARLNQAPGLQMGLYFYSYLNPLVIIMACCAYCLAFQGNNRLKLSRPLNSLAEASLGIYLVHPVFIAIFKLGHFSVWSFNPLLSVPLVSLVVFMASFAVTITIRKIPYCRKVV